METPSLLARDDTFLGVCQGIGEDFGVSPLILRLAFTALLFFYPVAALAGYAALGGVVALSRRIAPDPRRAVVEESQAESGPVAAEPEPLPLAA